MRCHPKCSPRPRLPTRRDAASWNAQFVPVGTPNEVIERLHNAFAKAAADPGIQERLGKIGVSVHAKSRAELARFVQDESARWRLESLLKPAKPNVRSR